MPETPLAVAMSGGVDSSVVAGLMAREGRSVLGLTMQLWNQRRLPEIQSEGATGRCCSLDDVYDARAVAQHIGIPYYVVNFESQFEEQVVRPSGLARSTSRPATTLRSTSTTRRADTKCGAVPITARTRPTSSSA
jgi:tRNA U34 2-thiouridine synthase MnmA/TrmU